MWTIIGDSPAENDVGYTTDVVSYHNDLGAARAEKDRLDAAFVEGTNRLYGPWNVRIIQGEWAWVPRRPAPDSTPPSRA
jgi:hypothetical protein